MTQNVFPNTPRLRDIRHCTMTKGAIQSNHGRLGVITGFFARPPSIKWQKASRRTACSWKTRDTSASPIATVCLTYRHEILGQPWEIMRQPTCLYIAKRENSIGFRYWPPRPVHLPIHAVLSKSNRTDSRKLGFIWAGSLSVSRWGSWESR